MIKIVFFFVLIIYYYFWVFMQTCSEMVSPIGIGKNETMFQADPFNLTEYMDSCNKSYGVVPRPHWITTYYGGHVSVN